MTDSTITANEIAALIERIHCEQLSASDRSLAIELLQLLISLLQELADKRASLAKLRRLLFGPKSEKRLKTESPAHCTQSPESPPITAPVNSDDSNEDKDTSLPPVSSTTVTKLEKKKGHVGVQQFPGAKTVICLNKELDVGSRCPNDYCRGHLYDTNEPQIFIQRQARPIIDAIKYQRQVLRCSFCEDRFAAPLPVDVSAEKYNESADVMMVLLKYSSSIPFYRLERLQVMMGVPLPASTQFERVESVANIAHPVFLALMRQAAQSDLLHCDDTSVRILSLIKENESIAEGERTGMYTTGIGARCDKFDIVIYCSGRMYAGENLTELLQKRANDLTEPILMADAESKNWSKAFRAIVALCLAHGRRKFVDCESAFRSECGFVLDMLANVYHIDAQTKQMSAQQRLDFHQEHSKPIMDNLKQWLEEQISQRKTQPNSSLGKAIKYMIRRWTYLTRFLTVAGCPLDNNFIERSLRRAVIIRKNSLFYKTEHGAAIGDILASIIETCALNHVNAYQYLMALLKNAKAVRAQPHLWLPWNYQLQKEPAV